MAEGKGKPKLPISRADALSLAAAVLITLIAILLSARIREFAQFGYAGVFLISLISSATILIPLPGFAVVFALGRVLNPFLVGVLAGLGSGIGELTGYMAGYAGHDAVTRTKLFRQHKKGLEKYGAPAIFLLAFIPNPAFDIAGIAAGAIKMRWWKFLIAVVLGKVLRYILLAYFGLWSLGWL